VRFFLDNDVPVSVRRMLERLHHDCWTAAQAGLADESQDENLTVYADNRHAVLVTLDKGFTQTRRRNPIGRHVRLSCSEPEAAHVLEERLAEVLGYLERAHVTLIVSKDGIKTYSTWG
jgi:predicted nuclease of predicted toxin-antitoxin system